MREIYILKSPLFLLILIPTFLVITVSSNNNDSTTAAPVRRRLFNIFPEEPDGPYYGQVEDTKNAVRRQFIPRSATGSCEKGTSYTIRSPTDFRNHLPELQCIFSSGLTPSKVPDGPHYTGVLLLLNSNNVMLTSLINFAWEGNAAFKIKCHNTSDALTYVGIHNLLGRVVAPYTLCVRQLTEKVSPGEHEDGKESLIMEFPQDFHDEVCPNFEEFVKNNQNTLPIRIKEIENVYPFNQVLDVVKFVGRQEDGAGIYLGKTYIKDYYRKDKQAATFGFWYFVNYDHEVNPEFRAGQSLPPLEETFSYTFPGFSAAIQRYSPVDNVISRPFATLSKFTIGVLNTGRASVVNFRELMRNFGSLRMNSRRLRDYFTTGRPQRRRGRLFNIFQRRN